MDEPDRKKKRQEALDKLTCELVAQALFETQGAIKAASVLLRERDLQKRKWDVKTVKRWLVKSKTKNHLSYLRRQFDKNAIATKARWKQGMVEASYEDRTAAFVDHSQELESLVSKLKTALDSEDLEAAKPLVDKLNALSELPFQVKPFKEWTEGLRNIFEGWEVKIVAGRPPIFLPKFQDRTTCQKILGQAEGFLKEQHEVAGPGGGPITFENVGEEERAAIREMARTIAKMEAKRIASESED